MLIRRHEADCEGCRGFVRRLLDDARDDLDRFGTVVACVDEPPGRSAWVAVTDEWDEVYHLAQVVTDHAWPTPAEIVDWVRFVSMQCPECESPEVRWLERRPDRDG